MHKVFSCLCVFFLFTLFNVESDKKKREKTNITIRIEYLTYMKYKQLIKEEKKNYPTLNYFELLVDIRYNKK